jgi:hypothetical protein
MKRGLNSTISLYNLVPRVVSVTTMVGVSRFAIVDDLVAKREESFARNGCQYFVLLIRHIYNQAGRQMFALKIVPINPQMQVWLYPSAEFLGPKGA